MNPLQSRTTPYRTHTLAEKTESELFPGRYTGRVLDILQISETHLELLVLMEDHCCQLSLLDASSPAVGSLIAFDVTPEGVCHIESLMPSQVEEPVSCDGDVMRWRKLGKTPSRMQYLRWRHQILKTIRHYFDQCQFIEVHTPLLVKAPNPEAHFSFFQTQKDFLITSPELHMKRMLVGGFEQIYQISSCFRNHELGTQHNPEFTMLEWYRAYERLDRIVHDVEQLFLQLLPVSPICEGNILHQEHQSIQLKAPWPRKSVYSLFQEHLDIDLSPINSGESLMALAKEKGHHDLLDAVDPNYSDIFFRLWESFEGTLGKEQPLWVYDWPKALSSLAQGRTEDSNVVERVELYIGGQELANGFGELNNPIEQRQRFAKEQQQRQEQGSMTVPSDEAFLHSLTQGMPPSAGMALGIERLVMLMTHASQIEEVLCFSWEER